MSLSSPDLAAFLIIQMSALAELAQRLDKLGAAQQWQRRADKLLTKLLTLCRTGDTLVALHNGAQLPYNADSLFAFLPLILGKKLPTEIQSALIAGLQKAGGLLTAHGLASENPASAAYVADGYWRGPIWAPATLLIVGGLVELGANDLAREISRRFCDTVQRSGMAENFDALSGAGLRDRAHTWTASVFLILAHEYLGD